MENKYYNLIINLHDGSGAGQSGEGESGASGESSTNTDSGNVSRQSTARAKQLNLSGDLLESYNKAYGNHTQNNKADSSENTDTTEDSNDDLEKEFDEAVKGKYKDAFQKRMSNAVLDRMAKRDSQIKNLESQVDEYNAIFDLLANKYPNVDVNDRKALFEAIRNDDSIFTEKAMAEGTTTEEAKSAWENQKEQDKISAELEELRRDKAARELDTRLKSLALQTKQTYPDFDLEAEMANPQFRSALDFIAKQNSDKNKSTGSNDEVFDLTFAYEMAHQSEIRNNTIKRAGKAAISAVTQSIAAQQRRPRENANSHSTAVKSKSVNEMTDAEFSKLLRDVKSGRAKIPT